MQVTGGFPEKPQWSGQPASTDVRLAGVWFDVDGGSSATVCWRMDTPLGLLAAARLHHRPVMILNEGVG
jgi:hypothetical protein